MANPLPSLQAVARECFVGPVRAEVGDNVELRVDQPWDGDPLLVCVGPRVKVWRTLKLPTEGDNKTLINFFDNEVRWMCVRYLRADRDHLLDRADLPVSGQ